MYYCCGITDKGIMKHNEDAYMIDGKVITEGNIDFMVKAPFIAAVSDGVSGENYGEIASKKCLEFLSQIDFNSETDLKKAVLNVHHIKQISRDQSLVQLLYEEGTITADEKKHHVHKNIIFPVMGNISAEPKPDIKNLNEIMKYGDLILICSDGLSDYVSCTEMEDILDLPAKLPKRLERLVKLAIDNGSQDNITIIALCCYD